LLPFYKLSEYEIVLMDSGVERDSSVADYFEANGMRVAAIFTTHGHFDHVGGHSSLRERFGSTVYLPQEEYLHTVDDPAINKPPLAFAASDQLCGCTPDILIPIGCTHVTVKGRRFDIIHCPGHTAGHVAYVTPDRVCYLGDLLASANYLSAAKLLFEENLAEDRRSKEQICNRSFAFCVAHRGVIPGEQLPELVQKNLNPQESTSTLPVYRCQR